jgi:adenylate kinase family enzyme
MTKSDHYCSRVPEQPRRILVYGVTGSGKSTLAAELGRITGLPVHLVDDEIGWMPGWVEVGADEQRRRAAALAEHSEWILDSAYGRWRDLVLPRAELIVGLDYPRWLSLSRLLRRTVRRARDKQVVCNGNVETWRQAFSKESILVWHFRSFGRKRACMRAWAADPPADVVLLRSPREADRWLAGLTRANDARVER